MEKGTAARRRTKALPAHFLPAGAAPLRPRPLEGVRRRLPDFGSARFGTKEVPAPSRTITIKGNGCGSPRLDSRRRSGAAAPLPRALPGPRRPRPARHPHLPPPPARHGEPRATPRTEPRTRSRAVLSNSGRGVPGGGYSPTAAPTPPAHPPTHTPRTQPLFPSQPPRTAGHRPRPALPSRTRGAHKAPRRARSAHSRRAARAARGAPHAHTHARTPRAAPPRTKALPEPFKAFTQPQKRNEPSLNQALITARREKGRPARSPVGVTRSVRAGAGGARRRGAGHGAKATQRLPPAARFAFYRAAAAAASP